MMGHTSAQDKVIAVAGNGGAWLLSGISQDFTYIAAGICSLCTAIYFVIKSCREVAAHREEKKIKNKDA